MANGFSAWSAMSPEAQANQLKVMQMQDIQAQRMALAQQQQSLAPLANFTPQENLQPLMNLTDQWTGSNFAQTYRPPETALQRMQLLAKAQGDIAERSSDITKSQLGVLKETVDQSLAEKRLQQMLDKKESRPMQSGDIEKITDADQAIESIKGLASKIEQNKGLVGPIEGLQKLNPFATRFKQLESDINNVRQMVGKAKEGGVLRKEDEEKYKKIVGSASDTPEVILHKLNALSEEISGRRETHISNLKKGKFDISGFQSAPTQTEEAIKIYQGKKYKLKPGSDKNKKENWEIVE